MFINFYTLAIFMPFVDKVHAWLSIRTFIKYFKGRYDFLRLQSSCTLLIVVITGCGFAFAAFAGLAGRDVLAVHYRGMSNIHCALLCSKP